MKKNDELSNEEIQNILQEIEFSLKEENMPLTDDMKKTILHYLENNYPVEKVVSEIIKNVK